MKKICELCKQPITGQGKRFCGVMCTTTWRRTAGFKQPFDLWVKKYGLEEAHRRAKERDNKRSLSMMGAKNHFFGKDHSEEFKQISSQIHRGKIISADTRRKMSEGHAIAIATGVYDPGKNFGKSGLFVKSSGEKEFFASSYEETRMKFLDHHTNVKTWTKRHGIVLQYELNGTTRSYIPDFFVALNDGRIFLEEIKGWVREEDRSEFDAKNSSARIYCDKMGWMFSVIWQKDLEVLQ